jgi:hypothetical protein
MEKLLVDLWGARIIVEGDVWVLGAAIIIVGIVAAVIVLSWRHRHQRAARSGNRTSTPGRFPPAASGS